MSKLKQLAMEYLPQGKTLTDLVEDKRVLQELTNEIEAELNLRMWTPKEPMWGRKYVPTEELQTTKK